MKMSKKKVAALFSGGKDSTLAMFKASQNGMEIACVVSVAPKNKYSYMFHTPSISQVEKMAKAMQIPIVMGESLGKKEDELEDLKSVLAKAKQKYGVEGVVTGAVASVYQASRVKRICKELELESINPLWQMPQEKVLNELIENRFEAVIVGVAAEALGKSWLLRKIDSEFVEDMRGLFEKYKINIAGEGGEYESLVLNSPMHRQRLRIVRSKILSDGDNHRAEVVLEL